MRCSLMSSRDKYYELIKQEADDADADQGDVEMLYFHICKTWRYKTVHYQN